jgi:hypothetical protein
MLAAVVATSLLAPTTVLAWGSVGHHYIAQNYSQHLPPVIDGLRAYDSVVDAHVTDADTRKSSTPGESYRHYIDIDWYPEFLAGTLSRDRATLEAEYGASTVLNNGIVPWAVPEVVATLTQQFQAQQWSAAARTIAGLCHYVGDANQPFHCAKNYDGQLTGNNGIHARYETTMISTYVGQLHTSPMPVTYYPSPQDAMFNLIGISYTGVAPILAADNTAKAASGGTFNATYYASLWNSTKALTQARLDTASVMTASFVYTAWVNAGQPAVPGSTTGVPPGGTPHVGIALAAGPSPFRDAVTVRYSTDAPSSVDVYDVRGSRVAHLAGDATGAGVVTWRPGASGVEPGLYFVRLVSAAGTMTRRVALIR